MQFHFITWVEAIGVFMGLIFLGFLGTVVTPKGIPERPLVLIPASPEDVIEEARSGYQMDTCVRDIAPRTVLSNKASGAPEIIVLAGAPVTECFPDLAEFAAQLRDDGEGSLKDGKRIEARSTGTDVRTSVNVLLPSAPATTSMVMSSVPRSAGSSSISSEEIPTSPPPPLSFPTGGGGNPMPLGEIPPVDVFDACRREVFGDRIPEVPTSEEGQQFEACLMRVVSDRP